VESIIMVSNTRRGRSATLLSSVVAAAAIAAVTTVQPAAAQQLGGRMSSAIGAEGARMVAPGLQLHAVNPSMSLGATASSPLQQQMQDDYATSLMGAQRQLLQQNPSGTGRAEMSIGNQLNSFMGPR
jgi:hypothetical protein